MSAIRTPHEHDVLCGRGGKTLNHVGNFTFRQLVLLNKPKYVACRKPDKIKISQGIVRAIRGQDPPGRFLERDSVTGLWNDIGNKRAVEKTSQALREGQRKILRQISAPSSLSSSFFDANESISSVATSLSDPSRRESLATISTPNIDAFSQQLESSVFRRSSSTSGNVHQESTEPLEHIELSESVDQEITDLICQTFANSDNDEFDDAIDEVMGNNPDNNTAHINDTSSADAQTSDMEQMNYRPTQAMFSTFASVMRSQSYRALTREEPYACMLDNASEEKEDNATSSNSIAGAAIKKGLQKGSSQRSLGNRAA